MLSILSFVRYKQKDTKYLFLFIKSPRIISELTMQNLAGEYVDLYIPRKCSASNRILAAKDHASVQLNFADVSNFTLFPPVYEILYLVVLGINVPKIKWILSVGTFI